MKTLLQMLFGSRSNIAACVINTPSFISSQRPSFIKNRVKSFVLCIALSLTVFSVSAQFLSPLETTHDGESTFITPNFSNLWNIIWDVRRPEKVIKGLMQYQYERSLTDTNTYIGKSTKAKYFVEFWENADDEFVRIYASGYYNLKGYYKWNNINPLKGLGSNSVEKESDIDGWHCYFEKMDPIWGDGHYIYAIKQHQGDTLEVSCTRVKRR
jgi:hypothetical protein